MSFSLNEVDATAKKATRGVGYSWGQSEEAGKATRWLCAQGLDGLKALATLLIYTDGTDIQKRAPHSLQGDWQAESGAMCPIIAGTALADSASIWAGNGLNLNQIMVPVLILPFAAIAARDLDSLITIEWNGVMAVLDGSAISLTAPDTASLLETVEIVSIRLGGQFGKTLPHQNRASHKVVDWHILNQFAARTYAPATEESRLKGAGAGLSDND